MNETLRRPPAADDTSAPLASVVAVIAAALDAPLPLRLAVRCDLAEVMALLDEANTIWAVTDDWNATAPQLRHAVGRAAALARVVAELFRRQAADTAAADWLAEALALASRLAAATTTRPAVWPLHLAGDAFDIRFEGHLLATVAAGLHDFTGADLSAAELGDVPLAGIRWSPATRWPDGWAGHVEALSVEREPGRYEIRAGASVRVPT
ncbi:hypothetical protein [Phytomonospora endophytica]|uniref:Uncharacterized protein n=1 Tax=Phytomonospora endophytica TaxID=714109 RepID=A0A841FQC1_9ACTN|nr:hypothetical protein [Phytomonospora endophytica]MBB6035457.1 hypothetical protein [Phytomonospora endophytica]GIG63789.1 hypothetical protein Pen01_00840 [Phytomonospora endophytica]